MGVTQQRRNQLDHLAGERNVFRFLRIDAQPGAVGDSVAAGAERFDVEELMKIIGKR